MKEVDKLIATLHPLERNVLPYLHDHATVAEIVRESNTGEVQAIRAIQWLSNKRVLTYKKTSAETISLGKNGQEYLEKGLPERRFLQVLEDESLVLKDVQEKADLDRDELNISLGMLKRLGAISLGKELSITSYGKKLITQKLLEETFLKTLPRSPSAFDATEKKVYEHLKQRKDVLVVKLEKTITIHLTDLGKKLVTTNISSEFIDSLNRKLITSGDWKDKEFRRYDVEINVPRVHPGKRHFVNQAVDYIKRVWLDMGFKEMEGPMVETAFWNFDSLFVPQDHPARDMQDTFFVNGKGKLPNQPLVNAIKKTHENGWTTGSAGWKYQWNLQRAQQLVLRTHTTSLSARTLASLEKEDLPAKYFSVEKCFRNETLDWKHSFEFIQVEGIVVDENANFKHLLGYLKNYYAKLGITKLRFRPAYFPYTEMSVETDYFHPVKKEWVEFGGAGLFRPEVVKPLLGFEVPVLAWGQGMERSIMEYYKIKDLRHLSNNDIQELKDMKLWLR